MVYFHVLLRLDKADVGYEQIFSDLSESELKVRFLKPYRNAKDLFVGGRIVKASQIASILIVRTKETNEVTRERINTDSLNRISEMNSEPGGMVIISPGSGYDPEDILEEGKDVTVDYVDGPPGSGKVIVWASFVNHPWVVTIVGGLALAGLIALIGLG